MSKRRINKQQTNRIEKIQQKYQLKKESADALLFDGLVLSRFSRHVELENEQGRKIRCSIRPNLETLVAGDNVIWQKEGINQGVVVSIHPRSSVLARPTEKGLAKPVAANITQLIVVVAPKPEISWSLLDSYLIMAELLNLPAIILLNKIDLPCEAIKKQLYADYQTLGYPIVTLCKDNSDRVEHFQQILNNQLSVFVGQSGVGKSSIISALLPHEEAIATGSISTLSELGKHTTSNSRYYHLVGGGALIDSPGVREFSLWNVNSSAIASGYKEFSPYVTQCKFRNCTHIDTPYCALIAAVKEHKISLHRYNNFVKLCSQYK